jgi:CheY-like chemotaxis protein
MGTPASLNVKLVFVVDDEASIADTLTLMLRREGFTVRTFYDGLAALEQAGWEHPDIVVSDVVMPKMDGFTLTARLREQLPHCRVLLISGNAYSSTELSEWRDKGGPELEMLAKPFLPETFIRKVKAMAADPSGALPE